MNPANILSGALVLITAYYAFTTHRIAKINEKVIRVMRDQNEALIRPYIQVSLRVQPKQLVFFLCIENTGKTAARNLRLAIDRDFFAWGEHRPDRNLRSYNAFRERITCFPPGSTLNFDLGLGPTVFREDVDPAVVPRTFVVTATYDYFEKAVSEETSISFDQYRQSTGGRDSLLDEAEKIRRALEEISKSAARISKT